MNSPRTNPFLLGVAVLLALAFLLPQAMAQEISITPQPPEWGRETVKLFASLPVQDSGRVKPLDTYAQFTLLRLNGKRTFTTQDGTRLGPAAWLMNCLFYPEAAKNYAHFIVDNQEVVSAAGIPTHAGKRDRYSYAELAAGRDKLFELAQEYNQKDPKLRTPIEQQILNLANNVFEFEQLIHYFDFAQTRFSSAGESTLAKALPEEGGVPYSVALQRAPQVMMDLRSRNASLSPEVLDLEVKALSTIMDDLNRAAMLSQSLALLPPDAALTKEWRTPADMLAVAFDLSTPREQGIGLLGMLEELHAARKDPAAFQARLQAYHDKVAQLASARGEYRKVPIEVFFYKAKLFFYSQWLYVLAFLLIALSWLLPRKSWTDWTSMVMVLLPTLLLIVGITLRCIIRGRPPVSTLYETILFITACVVLMAIVMEYINRQRIAIAVGAVLGAFGMFLAYRYELKEGVDTMPSLVAVLDTNFWLSTHVTSVTAGYAAGLLAGAIAHIYLFSKLFRFRKDDKNYYRTLARMCYGTLCFGLIFSTVGTILGGIWANYSWGRFWGWDPKENGALMIVLWSLVILHARMGRYIGDIGTAVCSVILAMIVAFSWWGVNLLGVGLHSYGFTSGIMNMLMVYWLAECVVIALGCWIAWREGRSHQQPAEPTPPPGEVRASKQNKAKLKPRKA